MMRDIDSMTQLIQLISIKWLTGQRYDTMVQSFDDPMMRHLDSMTQLSNDTLQRFNHSLYYPMVWLVDLNDTVVQWYDDTMIRWYDDTMQWFDSIIRLFIRWPNESMTRRVDSMIQIIVQRYVTTVQSFLIRPNGMIWMTRWSNDTMIRWYDDTMQWFDYPMVWLVDSITWLTGQWYDTMVQSFDAIVQRFWPRSDCIPVFSLQPWFSSWWNRMSKNRHIPFMEITKLDYQHSNSGRESL